MRLRALLDYFDDLETAWHASAVSLRAAGLNQAAVEKLLYTRSRVDLEAEVQRLERLAYQREALPEFGAEYLVRRQQLIVHQLALFLDEGNFLHIELVREQLERFAAGEPAKATITDMAAVLRVMHAARASARSQAIVALQG